MTETYDIAVIGGGPVGMFAAFYASLRDCKVALIEALPDLGGQPLALYPEKKVYDVPGLAGLTSREMVVKLKEQLDLFDVDVYRDSTVTDLVSQGSDFDLTIKGSEQIAAHSVVLATGKGSFQPRKIQLSNHEELLNNGLAYFASHPQDVTGKTVAVVGGGDSAVDTALLLNEHAAKTYLVHRRDKFRAMEQSVKALQHSSVDVQTPRKVAAITQAGDHLDLTLEAVTGGDAQTLPVDLVVVQYGFIAQDKNMRNWDVQFDRQPDGLVVARNQATNQAGIFAIGDVVANLDRTDLIAVGLGQAPVAVNAAVHYFDPDRGGPGHSSDLNLT
ncbi:NAD(P)/FAD-dependent oxidoreductase [Leuconostocaceae bacterium ESL0723]|nr:NAD(P)/FAD-dependent oxidoreductase [Leuconostocaceae bacterium ESL0723]